MEEATIIQQDAVLKSEVLRDNFEIMEGSDPRLEYTDEELGTDDLIKQEIIEIVETKIEPTTSEDFKVVKSESFLQDFKINEGLEGPKEEFETGPIIQQEIIEIVETKIEPTTSKDFKVVKNESFLEDFKINEGLEGPKEEFETGPIIQQEIIETFDMKIEPTTSQNFFVLKPVKVDNEDDSYYKTTVSDDEPLVKREIVWVDEMNTENDEVVNIKMEQDCFGDGTSNAGGGNPFPESDSLATLTSNTKESTGASGLDVLSSDEEYKSQPDGCYVCKWCGKSLATWKLWFHHKRTFHKHKPPDRAHLFKCDRCNVFFKSHKGYRGHLKSRHSEVETKPSIDSSDSEDPELQEETGRNWMEKVACERLVSNIFQKVKRECEATGSGSRRGYTRRKTVMNT